MTDTPKPTLAEVLDQLRYDAFQASISRYTTGQRDAGYWMACKRTETIEEIAKIAAEHESRWSAERAKLVAELKDYRALAQRARELEDRRHSDVPGSEVSALIVADTVALAIELARLAKETG